MEGQRLKLKITMTSKGITAMKFLPRFMFKFTVVPGIIQTENKKIQTAMMTKKMNLLQLREQK